MSPHPSSDDGLPADAEDERATLERAEQLEVVADARDEPGTIPPTALDALRQGDVVHVNDNEVVYTVADALTGEYTLPAVYLECDRSAATFLLETRQCRDLATGAVEERVVLVARTPEEADEVARGVDEYGEPVDRLHRLPDGEAPDERSP